MPNFLNMSAVPIVDFQPQYAAAFKALNEEWIGRWYALEAKDAQVLDDPQGRIIDPGGWIFIALEAGEAVGCCAMIPMADGGYEIAKMAVGPAHQGRGHGRALLAACIERARARTAPRLYLESGSRLAAALRLYRDFGFVDLDPERRPVSAYARVDVWMELRL